MRQILTVFLLGSALALFGIFTAVVPSLADEATAPKSEVAAPVTEGESAKQLIKCSTCGVEFTTLKEAQEHIKTHPGHKLAPIPGQTAQPLIKCSTCGVEFTTREEAQEHLKTHPGHKLVPQE
jgi:DNA-directed RNA polymerase subunit RPC12/RpoP